MLTTYLAGYIEHDPAGALDWRNAVKEKLKSDLLQVYCPISYEAIKTGKPAGEHVKYVTGLKRAGHLELFKEEMRKIWWGKVRPKKNRYEVIQQFRYRSLIDDNKPEDLQWWGDYEAVARSDFIIVYYKHSKPSWGTPAEAQEAFFLDIPIYVISDVPKTEMNSSLYWWVLETNGDVFYKLEDCVKYIKEKHKI